MVTTTQLRAFNTDALKVEEKRAELRDRTLAARAKGIIQLFRRDVEPLERRREKHRNRQIFGKSCKIATPSVSKYKLYKNEHYIMRPGVLLLC
jgi:hypothetical protein